MGRLFSQLLLLVKKNFILQYRRPVGALVELLLPCVFLGLIAMTRFATPVEYHCFSYFDPMPPTAFHENYQMLSVIGMAPDNEYVRNIAEEMAKNQDYFGYTPVEEEPSLFSPNSTYIVRNYTKEEFSKILAKLGKIDFTNPTSIWKVLSGLKNDIGQKTIAILPDVEYLQETLIQSSQFFSAAVEWGETDGANVAYTLRGSSRYYYGTQRAYPSFYSPGPRLSASGYNQGWISLQQVIDRSILLTEGIARTAVPVVSLRQMPYPTWDEDGFANAVRNSLPLILVISFLWIGASISKELVGEKASRMKETMKMMGLENWVLWLSWVIQRVVLMLIAVLLMVIVLKVTGYLVYSGAVIIYIFLLVYAMTVMCFCFFLSTLFAKTTTAIAGTMLGYFILYVPYFFLGNEFDNMSNTARYLSCLLSSTCMGFGANIISKWETMNEGLQFGNVATQTSDLDVFTMADVLLMLVLDIFIYSLLTWYVEAVFPGDYGIKQKPWFFVTRKYWFGSLPKQEQRKIRGTVHTNTYNNNNTNTYTPNLEPVAEGKEDLQLSDVGNGMVEDFSGAHEKGPRDKTVGIAIKGLVKRFKTPKGKITAVNGLTLDMYEDQITSLLGHNGAGKTTTMSMLTGLFSPSGGDALINGYSILRNLNRVRDSLGICPQHNVLFDRLTVMEHLDFFIRLKGFTGDVKREAQNMIKMLKLTDKKNSKADQLSGGMKRKLSVGIALAGGSRVIILDEPTAGMDPYARRATWDLILENKKSRTILLTTHYMDEADFLGDRVAIMTAGKLVCSGSSLFLKKKYGVGYHLTLVKSPGCDVPAVDTFIKSSVVQAQKISDVGSELVYILPENEVEHFVGLFKKLEDGDTGENVNIESFGLSLTTMEEVFMKVGESTEDKNMEAIAERQDNEQAGNVQFKVFKQNELNSGGTLLAQQLLAMIIKRFINTKRYKKGIIVQLILPLLFAALGLLVVATTPDSEAEPIRAIDLSAYPGSDVQGHVYLQDFTGADFFTTTMRQYLASMTLTEQDITEKLNKAIEKYGNDIDEDDKCCNESALELYQYCAEKGDQKSNWGTCSEKEDWPDWGYNACYNTCFLPKSGEYVDEECGDRRPPDPQYVDDKLSYFVNVFLDQVGDDTRFYKKNQVAYTYSEVPKFVNLVYQNNTSTGWNDTSDTDFTLSTLDETATPHVLTGWFSHEGLHLAPGVQNALSNMLLIKGEVDKTIYVNNKPLPESLVDRFNNAAANIEGTSLAILMLLGFSFLTSSFVLFVVEERENKSKHLQQISGVNGVVYWLGTLIWDMVNYTVCILVIIILFAIFNLEGYDIGAVFLILLMYGYASIPFVYLCSLLFSSPVTAFSIIAVFTYISGLAGYIANIILTFLDDDFQETLELILIFLPNFDFIQGLSNIYANGIQAKLWNMCIDAFSVPLCQEMGLSDTNVYDMEGWAIGKQLVALFVVGTVSFILVLVNEVYGKSLFLLLDQLRASSVSAADLALPEGEDEDVLKERTRVMCEIQNMSQESAVVFKNLRKCYGKHVAVQNLTLGIPKNECFGLLGVNGAGKTTTFSMLTGDITMSNGDAYIAGYDIKQDMRKIQQRIGYCPQFDALIGIMTGRELLRMFANMRGIPRHEVEQTVNEAITNLNLGAHADKLCGSYSGGNKRKLSTAVALVGNPEVLFLDEPTAGMDPTARRFLWTVLAALTSANIGTSIVLTTHSMEECEALCNRLVIMVNGAFRCLGSIQHLKTKYGAGYTITLTMTEEKQDECAEFVQKTFPGALCKEEHLGYLHYELSASVKWSYIFDQVETHKARLAIEDYAVNQTSLEQVFLNFAKDQADEDASPAKKAGCLSCCKRKTAVLADFRRHSSRVVANRGASLKHRSSSYGKV